MVVGFYYLFLLTMLGPTMDQYVAVMQLVKSYVLFGLVGFRWAIDELINDAAMILSLLSLSLCIWSSNVKFRETHALSHKISFSKFN